MKKVFNFLLVAAVSAAVSFFVSAVNTYDTKPEDGVRLSQTAPLPVVSSGIPAVAERLMPSVVGISSTVSKRSLFDPSAGELWSMGSGFAVSDAGHILTNQHVVANATKIYVTTNEGDTVTASPVWSDAGLDLAVLKLDAGTVPPASLGDSSAVTVGEGVIAIGNPLSLQFQRTVTAGIVSALNRTIALSENGQTYYMEDLIQTDASINPGNSGGPLIDMSGNIIAINTVKVTSAEGMGFAIPINLCRPVIDRIMNEGSFETPYLGLYAYDRAVASYVVGGFPGEGGIYVTEIDNSGPAYSAGVRKGDVITHVDNIEIHTMLNLRERLFYHKPGEKVKLNLLRGGRTITIEVTLTSQ